MEKTEEKEEKEINDLDDENVVFVPQKLVFSFESIFEAMNEAQKEFNKVADVIKTVKN